MARNTLVPLRMVQGTTAQINNITGEAGEVLFDTDRKTLVAMDGVTEGGIPLAKGVTKIKAGSANITVNGGTEGTLGSDITIDARTSVTAGDGISVDGSTVSVSQVFQNDISAAKTAATAAQTAANLAKSAADTAQSTADTAQSTADTAKTAAANAQATANSVNSAVSNATTGLAATKKIADEAKTAAANAQSTADTAKSIADTVTNVVNNNTTGLAATKTIADAAKSAAATAQSTADGKLGKNENAVSATKLATARTIQTNLASASAASFDGTNNITPGITGTLPAGNGGTGQTSLQATRNAMGLGNTTGALPVGNGGTGAATAAAALTNLGAASATAVTTAQTTANTAVTNAANAQTTANTANATANAALPKAGGTMTGDLFVVTPTGYDYSTRAASTAWVVGFAQRKIAGTTNIYVGGSNASDTANLNAGRGFSSGMPFATAKGALNWVRRNLASGMDEVNIMLQANDASLDAAYNYYCSTLFRVTIMSDATMRTMTMKGFTLHSGRLEFSNITVVTSGTIASFVNAMGQSEFQCRNTVTFSGAVSTAVLCASKGGVINLNTSIGGSVTGKKYQLQYGGFLSTNGGSYTIPGNTAGTCDSHSTYC